MNLIVSSLITFVSCFFLIILNIVLDSEDVKKNIAKNAGNRLAFYRIFYVALNSILLYLIIMLSPDYKLEIYSIPYPNDLIILSINLLALALLFWALMYVDLLEFLGISQIIRLLEGKWTNENLDMKIEIHKEGPFKFVRHPVYLSLLIIIFARPSLDLKSLIFMLFALFYVIFSINYDEKKYITRLGDDYKQYMEKVPRLFPFKIRG